MSTSTKYEYHEDSTPIPDSPEVVWVFGSNLSGIHGAGAALVAKNMFNAEFYVGKGATGRSYAIPTKGKYEARLPTLPLNDIEQHVRDFRVYADANPAKIFWVTRIGCGYAGYTDDQIAPLFKGCPANCNFATQWQPYLEDM